MSYLGLDIGGTKCAVLLGTDDMKVLRREAFPTSDKDTTLSRLLELADRMKSEAGDPVLAAGVSCGGPLDAVRGRIQSPPNLPGWDDVPITDLLSERLSVPAYLCNDADACALAEWQYGAGKGCENMIFLTFGTGMGAGLILNGHLYRGGCGMAGEVGHIRLSEEGPVGYGKQGSFEGFCSGGGIARMGKSMAREAIEAGEAPSFCPELSALETVSAKTIAEAADQGDRLAREVYCLCARRLGQGLSILIDILNPDRIVIGSVFQRSESLLRKEMEKVIEKETLPVSGGHCRILPSLLGDSLGDVAALTVARGIF